MSNYYLDDARKLALSVMDMGGMRGARTLIITGSPGTGKTSLAEHYASTHDAEYLYMLCHNWLSEEELFVGIDVGAVAVGVESQEDAYQPGVLLRAAKASQRGLTVVCIDELDKAPQKVETLLLDFLQSGRVHMPGDGYVQANLDNLRVVITSNGIRPLMAPTLRRGMRVELGFLPTNVELDLIREATGADMSVVRIVEKMVRIVRTNGETSPSLQEAINLVHSCQVIGGHKDAKRVIRGWLCKEEGDWSALCRAYNRPGAALWGQVKRGRN